MYIFGVITGLAFAMFFPEPFSKLKEKVMKAIKDHGKGA